MLAVSDGMGGALAGEVASKMAVETVSERLLGEDPNESVSPEKYNESLIAKLYDATVSANYIIHSKDAPTRNTAEWARRLRASALRAKPLI